MDLTAHNAEKTGLKLRIVTEVTELSGKSSDHEGTLWAFRYAPDGSQTGENNSNHNIKH